MVDFVDLMEARSLGGIDSEKDQDTFWFSDQWIMEPIYQGIRYQGLVYAPGKFKFHGKKKNYKPQDKLEKLTPIIKNLKSLNLPEQTLFEGYLHFQNDRARAFRFLKLDELDNCLVSDAQFVVTDLIYHAGHDVYAMPLFDRRMILQKIFRDSDVVKLQHGFVKNKQNVFESIKSDVKVFLFKDLTAKYKFMQSSNARIYKVPQTYYMVVMGYVESPDPRLKKMVVAIEGGQLKNGVLTKIMNIPVHGSDVRVVLYNNKDKYQGRVFEFLATEKTDSDDKYQEARFIKMRDDKELEDCIFL